MATTLMLGLIREDEPDAVPTVFGSTFLQLGDLVFGTIIFFLAVQQQNEVDKSAHRLAVVALLLAGTILLTLMQERIKSLASTTSYRRVWLAQVLCKVLWYALSFLSGLFARIISDQVTNGPMRGHLNVFRLVVPAMDVVAIIVFMFSITMLTSHRSDILRVFSAR
jgi:hypothetical protein